MKAAGIAHSKIISIKRREAGIKEGKRAAVFNRRVQRAIRRMEATSSNERVKGREKNIRAESEGAERKIFEQREKYSSREKNIRA
jgi:hypothetical protein